MASTKKSVTAAPSNQVQVVVTLKFKATGKPVVGATALLLVTTPKGLASRSLGKSDTAGRVKFNEQAGLLEMHVRLKNHQGETLQLVPGTLDTTVVFAEGLAPGPHEFAVSMVQIRTAVTLSVSDGVASVSGATVTMGTEKGTTNKKGRYITSSLALGRQHELIVTRNGHGPESSSVPGPTTIPVDLRGLTEVEDRQVDVKLTNFWGRIKSGGITVEGMAFPAWFGAFSAKFPKAHTTLKYHGTAAPAFPFADIVAEGTGFTKIFNSIAEWSSGELTLEEFTSVFFIIANETGGSFRPLSEQGSLQYMFYLNKGPNRLAGELLKERGILTDPARVLAWNVTGSKAFPGVGTDGATEADLKECDFWKFRGRGFVQTTSRTLYLDRVDQILQAAGLSKSDDLTSDELDDAVLNNEKVYLPLLRKELERRSESWAQTNAENWKAFGYAVAGTKNHEYADLFEWRCQQLFAALKKAAESSQLVLI